MRIAFVCLAIALLALAACGPKLFHPQEHVALVVSSTTSSSFDLALKEEKELENFTAYVLYKGKDKNLDAHIGTKVTQAIEDALKQHGYTLVTQPSLASCVLFVDVPYFGRMSQTQVESVVNAGYASSFEENVDTAKGTKQERIVLVADVHAALRAPQQSVRKHALVVTTASHKSLLAEGDMRLATMTTESGFVQKDVQASLMARLVTEIIRQLPNGL